MDIAIPFDVHLPGFLPPTHQTDTSRPGHRVSTSYGLLVNATLGWADHLQPFASSKTTRSLFANNSLRPESTDQSSSPYQEFVVKRHKLPNAVNPLAPIGTERHFTLKPELKTGSPVECIVTVPEWIDINGGERSFRITMRMRAKRDVLLPGTIPGLIGTAGSQGGQEGGVASQAVDGETVLPEEASDNENNVISFATRKSS
jgi:hypothetical protein